jgi:hypothetical protein
MNSKKLEKSRGILAFASNTTDTDYIGIAQKTLNLASKTLGLPTTLITSSENTMSNIRYDIDKDQFVEWKNFNRYSAYELSPYNETLVIDVDYLVFDKKILDIFDLSWDYILQRKSISLFNTMQSTMGPTSLPFIWATVFAFRKTKKSKKFFNLVQRIQENYSYYQLLFNIRERNFRNDYAFAIADIILNGYNLSQNGIPGNMLTVENKIKSIKKQNNGFIIKDEYKSYVIPLMNIHVLGKEYLQSDNFDELLNESI